MIRNRTRARPRDFFQTLEELEARPGPSVDITKSRVMVDGIYLLKESEDFGSQAAVATSEGYCWVHIKQLRRTNEKAWLAYCSWYEEEHLRHPLEDLRQSDDESSEDSGEPSFPSPGQARRVREIYRMIDSKSAKLKATFADAPGPVRTAVGHFLYLKKNFIKWRYSTAEAFRRVPAETIKRSMRRMRQTACVRKWRVLTSAAVSDSNKDALVANHLNRRWFNNWQFHSRQGAEIVASIQRSIDLILSKSLASWLRLHRQATERKTRYSIIWRTLALNQLKSTLRWWRIQTKTFNMCHHKPMCKAFEDWKLSAALQNKLALHQRWLLRSHFNQLCSQSRFGAKQLRRRQYYANWKLIACLNRSSVSVTSAAFNHHVKSLLVQGWSNWSKNHKEKSLDDLSEAKATALVKSKTVKAWRSKMDEENSSNRSMLTAAVHSDLSMLSYSMILWQIRTKTSLSLTEQTKLAISLQDDLKLAHTWNSWLTSFKSVQKSRSLMLSATTSQNSKELTKALLQWSNWSKKRRVKLELLEPHLELKYPEVFKILESNSPNTLWSVTAIAKAYWATNREPDIRRSWYNWRSRCIKSELLAKLLRNCPQNIISWLDKRTADRFMSLFLRRCRSTKKSDNITRAQAVWFTLAKKNMACRVQRLYANWLKRCKNQQLESSDNESMYSVSSSHVDSDDSSGDDLDGITWHELRPQVSSSWKSLFNTTASTHQTELPAPHVAQPVTSWSAKLSRSVGLTKEYTKLKRTQFEPSAAVIEKIPTIAADCQEKLLQPIRLWTTSLDEKEFISADTNEIVSSYTYTWCLPLWFDHPGDDINLVLWDCCHNNYTSMASEACLDGPESDEALADIFLTFQGSVIAEPRNKLSKIEHICTPLTIQGLTGQEAASVTHAASPLSRPANKRQAADETASDDVLLKTAQREAAAMQRSPFAEKDAPPDKPPRMNHVSHEVTKSKSLNIGQVSVLQTVSNTIDKRVGTIHAVDKDSAILIRWDGDDTLSEVSLEDLSLMPLPNPGATPSKSTAEKMVTPTVTEDSPSHDRCYNQTCGKPYEDGDHKCGDCNFPRDRHSWYGPCEHLTDPAKKWCQHQGCTSVNTHFLAPEHQAQLQVMQSNTSSASAESEAKAKFFKDRHSSLRTKLVYINADLRVWLLLRAGQTAEDLKYNRTMPAQDYMCTLIDTEVGALHRRDDNINQYKIRHTWRLYYKTTNLTLGGTQGLHALEFDRHVADGTSSSTLQSYDFSGTVNLEVSAAATKSYRDIEHWVNCHGTMNNWVGYHCQRALEQELKAAIAYLEAQYLDTLVEDIDVDVEFCEEVISSLEKDYCSELRLFVTDKEQHAIRYPDTIWRFSGYQFVRPKFWITHNGVERGSFSRQYRELKEIRRAQKLNDVVRELKQVKKALSTNSNNKNKPGGTGGTTNNGTGSAVEAWQARTWPVSTATETGNLLSTEDYNRAAVEYDNLCDTVENGKFKDLKDLCWRHCTRVGCGRKSCKRNESRKIPKELISKWAAGHLVAAAYGGFDSMPCNHKPGDITTVVDALRHKLGPMPEKKPKAPKAPAPAPAEAGEVGKPAGEAGITPAAEPSLDEKMKSLLLVRPQINADPWLASDQVISLQGDQIKVLKQRNWSLIFPGRLGSADIVLSAVEKDLGENLDGESSRCMILTEAAATGRSPSKLLAGYRSDAKVLRARLPDGSNSLIKMHLDLFQMNFDGPMPDNEEITSDLLCRSQPISYHYSQILEQEEQSSAVTVLIEITTSCESDKIERHAAHFVCLVGSNASPDSIIKFRKSENGHSTFLDDFSYYHTDSPTPIQIETLADYMCFTEPIEPISRCSFKPCVPLSATLTDFEGIEWPDFLPQSQLGNTTEFDLDYNLAGRPTDNFNHLTKFQHAAGIRNPNRITMQEFLYYMADEVTFLSNLAENKLWQEFDQHHFDWYVFPVDDTRRIQYAIWSKDAEELQLNEVYMKDFAKASALVLRSWGFQADGSACNPQCKDKAECGSWNGNFMRLYKIARSAWLLQMDDELLAAQAVARAVAPSGSFRAQGFDLSHIWSFTTHTPQLTKKCAGALEPIDQRLIRLSAKHHQQLELASTNVSKFAEDKEWFTTQTELMVDLVEAIDEKFSANQLEMLTRYVRMYNPDASGPSADANRIQRQLIDNPAVQLEGVIGRRLLESHRYGVPAEMTCSRKFRSSVINPEENELYAEEICKAARKLIVKGMQLYFPEQCLATIEKWDGFLLSPNLIVFTEKKPEGRICQAMTANKGDAPNDLMMFHNLLPCVYDHALEATRAVYNAKDKLAASQADLTGDKLEQLLMVQLFQALAYVDDFHVVHHDTHNVEGGGQDLRGAFNLTNIAGSAVGLISARSEVPPDWVKAMSKRCVLAWLVLNFGWLHSPPQHQPVPVAVRNGVNNTCARDIIDTLPGYEFRAADLSHLAMDALLRYIRYTEGYIDTIDMGKTQDIEGKLDRLGCTMWLDTLEIAVKKSHLVNAHQAMAAGDQFEAENMPGVPLGWVQTTLGIFRFAAVMPKSWILGFIVPLLRCLKGVSSDASKETLCLPSVHFQPDKVSLANLHRCRRALVLLLKLMIQNPQCARLPMYLLLPPAEIVQRAPVDSIIFCGHDACDRGMATLIWEPNHQNKIEVLLVMWPAEVRRLLLNSRHSELRKHDRDFLCMGNLEHACPTTNKLQWGDEYYFEKLALQITDNQPTEGVINKGFGANFVDQEMCRLSSLLKVKHTFNELAVWVQTWLNDLLDNLSRVFTDDPEAESRFDSDVMESVVKMAGELGIVLEFVEPSASVNTFLTWLASDKSGNLSLITSMEDHILADSPSGAGTNLRQLCMNKAGGCSDPSVQLKLLKSGACSLSTLEIAGRVTAMMSAASSGDDVPMLAAHICCGFGGMTIGANVAGFIPILNVENNPAAIAFHEVLTAGLICCGDLDNLEYSSLPRVHHLTVGWPCPPHTCLGKRRGWDDSRCRVKAVVKLLLATLPYTVFGECVPGLLTSLNGQVFKFIVDSLSPYYHIHYEVVKFAHFGHRSNRRRLLMALLLKSIFPEPCFSDFPTGHIDSLTECGPVGDCLIPTEEVDPSLYVDNAFTQLPCKEGNPAGKLTYTHTMDNIKGAGSPKCPPFAFDLAGLGTTQLATVFTNEEEHGVNTGLVFRVNKDGKLDDRPSKLGVGEQVNVGNFPYDTVSVAHAMGLSDNQISTGINNAVPPSVCYPISAWFHSKLTSALETPVMIQPNDRVLFCGDNSIHSWLSQGKSRVSKSGSLNDSLDATPPPHQPTAKAAAARALKYSLAAASLVDTARRASMTALFVQWEINWQLARVDAALKSLKEEAAIFCSTCSPSGSPLRSLASAATSAADLQVTALSIIQSKLMSLDELVNLPTDLKVELAEQLAAVVDSDLASRRRVSFWLANPCEAEASGNDWKVADDCCQLTAEVTIAWQMHIAEPSIEHLCTEAEDLLVTLAKQDSCRLAGFSAWQAGNAWRYLRSKLRLPILMNDWLNPTPTIPTLRVEAAAIELLQSAATSMIASVLEPILVPCLEHIRDPSNLLLPYILNHQDLAPLLMNELCEWPLLVSRATLLAGSDQYFGAVCTQVANNHRGDWFNIRKGRLQVWDHYIHASRGELRSQLVDDCRSSMVALTVQAACFYSATYSAVCKLSLEAVQANATASSDRSRILDMHVRARHLTTVKLHKLVHIRMQYLLAVWRQACRLGPVAGLPNPRRAALLVALINNRQQLRTSIVLRHWAMNVYAVNTNAAVDTFATPVVSTDKPVDSVGLSVDSADVTVDSVQAAPAHANQTSLLCNPRRNALLIALVRNQYRALVSVRLAWWAQNAAGQAAEAAPAVAYLAEERSMLRTFFGDKLGLAGAHVYLASTAVKSLPGGTFNPCEKPNREADFKERIPVKRKAGADVALGCLTRLIPSRPELHHVHICSRSPMAAQLVRALFGRKVTIAAASTSKNGGWDNIPASSIVYKPLHPSKGNNRVKLLSAPTSEELAAEKEFEQLVMGASLGGDTEKKYNNWVGDFTEYRHRCAAELLIENPKCEAAAALKNLRFWARRFFLSEGGVRGLAYSTVNCKACAIRWYFLINYGLDLFEGWVEHKIFMRGLKRIRHNPRRKLPVSWALLMYLVRQLREGSRNLVIKTAILVGWWFLCRISEIISFRLGSVRLIDSAGCKLDHKTDNLSDAVEVDLTFAVTKNDIDGDGAIRTHNTVESELCIVQALAAMITARREAGCNMEPTSPLFLMFDDSADSKKEKHITRATVVRVLKAAASDAGIPKSRISCHSLRSGGATAMLSVSGSSYSDVRLFGRWRSDCARIYLRAVRGMMTVVSARMAANSTDCTVMMAGGTRVKRY